MTRTTYTAVTALIVSLLTNARCAHAQTLASSNDRHSNVNAKGGGHLGVDSTVGEILRHPAFAGFSRLIFPWDDRDYAEQMPIESHRLAPSLSQSRRSGDGDKRVESHD